MKKTKQPDRYNIDNYKWQSFGPDNGIALVRKGEGYHESWGALSAGIARIPFYRKASVGERAYSSRDEEDNFFYVDVGSYPDLDKETKKIVRDNMKKLAALWLWGEQTAKLAAWTLGGGEARHVAKEAAKHKELEEKNRDIALIARARRLVGLDATDASFITYNEVSLSRAVVDKLGWECVTCGKQDSAERIEITDSAGKHGPFCSDACANPRTCDACGEPVGSYVQHAIDADVCSDKCLGTEVKRRADWYA